MSGFGDDAGSFELNIGGGGEIQGTVTDAATTAPLFDVSVDLWDGDGLFVAATSTDASGAYSFVGLTPGPYFVSTRNSQGYLDELYDDLLCPGGGFNGCDPMTGAMILIGIETIVEGVDLALNQGAEIEGRVIDASTDAGAADVRVELWDAAGEFLASTLTDASGDYAFDGLPGGTYFANTDSSDYADELYDDLPCPGGAPSGCDPTTGTPIAAVINDVTSGIDFELDRFGEITGTVTEAVTGLPLSSIEIELYSASGSYMGNDYTDDLGKYSIAGLSTGTYYAVAEPYNHADEVYDDVPCPGGAPYGCDPTIGTPIAVTINETTGGIDFVLDRLGSISGTVTEVGTSEPIVSLQVEVWRSNGSYLRSANTDSAGTYTVGRLNAGTYFLTTDDDRYANELYDDLPCGTQGCDPTIGTPVLAVLNVDTSNIDFALVERGSISGTVTDESTGDPIPSARVEIWSTDHS